MNMLVCPLTPSSTPTRSLLLQCLCRIYTESGYKSSVDYPGVTFFPEIFKQNPDVKVILSQRDSAEVLAHISFRLLLTMSYFPGAAV
jgi:hypothetical protein